MITMQCKMCNILIGPNSQEVNDALSMGSNFKARNDQYIQHNVKTAISEAFIDTYRKKHVSFALKLLDVHHDAEYEKFLVKTHYPKSIEEDETYSTRIKKLIDSNQSIQFSIVSQINELKRNINSLEENLTYAYLSDSLTAKIDEIEMRIKAIPELFDQLASGRK